MALLKIQSDTPAGFGTKVFLGDQEISKECRRVEVIWEADQINRCIVEFFPGAVDIESPVRVEVREERQPEGATYWENGRHWMIVYGVPRDITTAGEQATHLAEEGAGEERIVMPRERYEEIYGPGSWERNRQRE